MLPTFLTGSALLLLGAQAVSVDLQLARRAPPTYSATYVPANAPNKSQAGQTGTNQCGTNSSQSSQCQNAYINALDDFCLWAPPSTTSPYGNSAIGNTERLEVAWCLRSGYGTRMIPQGAITGAHWVQTPDYVQVTGAGDLTKLNIPRGDDGGELDPHGADGLGNPIGGLVFSTAFEGGIRQIHEWTNFMSAGNFCFRACIGPNAAKYCGHVWDVMGCGWNMPGDYSKGFSICQGNSTEPMGLYTSVVPTTVTKLITTTISNHRTVVTSTITTTAIATSTFHQGDPVTPGAHPAGPTSSCVRMDALPNLGAQAPTPTATYSYPQTSSASASVSSASSISSVSSVSSVSSASSVSSVSASVSSASSASSASASLSSASSTSRVASATSTSVPSGSSSSSGAAPTTSSPSSASSVISQMGLSSTLMGSVMAMVGLLGVGF